MVGSLAYGAHNLDQFFKYRSEGQNQDASKILNNWNTKSNEEATYKKYFMAISENKVENYWELYQELSKKKKILKLQHESIKKIIELDLAQDKNLTKDLKNFNKISKKMLKSLRGQPEGLAYELLYLKWIIKKNKTSEVCSTERNRWLSQNLLKLSEIEEGLKTCPMTYGDFLYRIRLLIFSGEEQKAQDEIKEYVVKNKMADWEKAYLEAVFFSNVGDPISAFTKISPFEKDLQTNEDYYLNLFYISQRAGKQDKAEEIINNILKNVKNPKKINEIKFQKAFLFYQTKKYAQAVKIFNQLVKTHKSHKRKKKSTEYDDLTWLRAWCNYLNKNYDEAKSQFKANAHFTRDKAKNLYWLAMTEWQLGNEATSLEYFRQLASPLMQGKFFNYYNYVAWLRFEANKSLVVSDLMRNQLSAIRMGRSQFLLPDLSTRPEDLAKNYQNYLDVVESTDQGEVTLINQENEVLSSPDTEGIKVDSSEALKAELVWADNLSKWGYRDLAKWHLYEVEKNLKTKSDVAPLAQYYLDNQFYNRAILLMQKVANPSSKKLSIQEDEIFWRSLFPRAFEKTIHSESQKQKINKYLVWSIMKAETQFKADAISPVGAVGLMQFMPYTSKKVAVLLEDEFHHSKMFNPDFAIQYGASYLKKLSDELGQEINLVAAGYNGGPHRVKLWLKNLKDDQNYNLENDAFIEHIPFNETRTYVKRVINFYLVYNKLYEEKFDLKSNQWLINKSAYSLKEPLSLKEEWPFLQPN